MTEPVGTLARLDAWVKRQWARIPTPLRIRLIPSALVLGTGGVLAVAAWLEPAAQGHATHLQLGLNPCSILSATGYPCPMCGATTTFALWAHGRPIDGLLNQPFATLLFWMTVGTFAISMAEILQPRRRWERILAWVGPRELPLVGAFVAILTISWIYKTALMT
jgi:hypothetical protein